MAKILIVEDEPGIYTFVCISIVWNSKRKHEVFLLHSRVQTVLFKDSANESPA